MVGESSTDNWGVVDDMVGGVGRCVSLDGHLGNMVDLMVDIVANMLDNRGSSNSNWSSVGNSNWGNSGSSMSNSGNSRGSSSISGNSRGSMGNSSDSRGSNSMSSSIDSSYKAMSKETMTIGAGNE